MTSDHIGGAGELAAAVVDDARARIAKDGFAPPSAQFDKGQWAHRGRVLSAVTLAATSKLSAGGDVRVLLVIAHKVLGLSTLPSGLLNAQNIAKYLNMSDRAVRGILASLMGHRLIEVTRDGQDVQICRIHPALFEAAREGHLDAGHVNASKTSDAC